eukprot:4784425-Prymnesium_polylepis.1
MCRVSDDASAEGAPARPPPPPASPDEEGMPRAEAAARSLCAIVATSSRRSATCEKGAPTVSPMPSAPG